MVKADIQTKDGTKIVIEGSAEEVHKIIAALERKEEAKKQERSVAPKQKTGEVGKSGGGASIRDLVLQIREGGFFDSPKGLADIKEQLQQEGYYFPVTSISPLMIRLVRRKYLTRIKEAGNWKYAKR
jgi:hypothetical protein